MKKSANYTSSLFEELEIEEYEDENFEEISHAYFLSLSLGMQLHYCWWRDLDSATRSESTTEASFFLIRAAKYSTQLEVLK